MIESIIILGMHRSGTSCLTGSLKSYGLNLGNVSEYNKYNKKGNQENPEIFRLNEAILNFNGGSWNNLINQELKWNQNHTNLKNEALAKYNKLPKPWGIKDPRMLLTLPFWENSLPPHAMIGTIRHPTAVAKSLLARKNLSVPLEQGYILWQAYNSKLLELYNKNPFPIINFDLPTKDYGVKIERIAKALNLPNNMQNSFVDNNLINQASYSIESCPEHLRDLYKSLLDITNHPQ